MLNEFGRVGRGNAIAIVEDDHEMRSMLAEFLASQGYEVHAYRSAPEFLGVADAAKGYFSLVISDVYMEGLNGLDMLAQMRKNDALAPVVLMTALPNARDQHRAERLGAAAYLRKPFPLSELLTQLRKASCRAVAPGA